MAPIPIPLVGHLEQFAERMKHYLNDDFSDATSEERDRAVDDVRVCGARCAALIAPMPLPFADVWAITSVQVLMVRAIGNIRGRKLDVAAAREVLGVIAGGIIGQQVCLQLFKWGLPGAGGLGGAAFVYVWTLAMALTANRYFESGGQMSKAEVRAEQKRNWNTARHHAQDAPSSASPETQEPTPQGAPSVSDRLDQLQVLLDQSVITPDEYAEHRKRILGGL